MHKKKKKKTSVNINQTCTQPLMAQDTAIDQIREMVNTHRQRQWPWAQKDVTFSTKHRGQQ